MSNGRFPNQETPKSESTGNNGGSGGGYYELSNRLTRIETEFKEVVKKSDLLEQVGVLKEAFSREVEKARNQERDIWYRRITLGVSILAVLISAAILYNLLK